MTTTTETFSSIIAILSPRNPKLATSISSEAQLLEGFKSADILHEGGEVRIHLPSSLITALAQIVGGVAESLRMVEYGKVLEQSDHGDLQTVRFTVEGVESNGIKSTERLEPTYVVNTK